MQELVVIDACGGNLSSLVHAILRLGYEPQVTSDPERVRQAARVILPGVGTAQDSMSRLRQSGLIPVLSQLTCPLLGICVGMQLLFESSEEGDCQTLGLLPGRVTRLIGGPSVRVPHMGWNRVFRTQDSRLLENIQDGAPFYFVHSYRAPQGAFVSAYANHGGEVPVLVEQGTRFGIQCHPEKSQAAGAQLLRNFLSL